MSLFKPFARSIDLETLQIDRPDKVKTARLSDMEGIYAHGRSELECSGDRELYEFQQVVALADEGHLSWGISRIYPGSIGGEYVMTQGHFHRIRDTAEVYFCLQGEGVLLCQAPSEAPHAIAFTKGTVGYVPPGWAHRVINTGPEDLVFFAVVQANAGHDYCVERVFSERFMANCESGAQDALGSADTDCS